MQDFPWAGNDLAINMTFNPAGQILTREGAHGGYAWTGHGSGTAPSPANGLNQLTSYNGAAIGYDAKGNMISDGARTFGYTAENRMATGPSTNLIYDPLGRLYGILSGGTILDHDGNDLIIELDQPTGTQVKRRYVHGPGVDEPLVWYEGSGTTDRRWLHADERGSIIAVSDAAGNSIGFNSYDEYGKPASGNIGRFQYTGQVWVADLGLYYYKNRFYDPVRARFVQADPLGYGDGPNGYAYVKGDPVNFTDPWGLKTPTPPRPPIPCDADACVTGHPKGPTPGVTGGMVIVPIGLPRSGDDECQTVTGESCSGTFEGNSRPKPTQPQLRGACSECVLMGLFPITRVIRLVQEVTKWFSAAKTRGLPPEGVSPPGEGPFEVHPASRRSDGGNSLWDSKGGEWRWHPGDRNHRPHWDYNPWRHSTDEWTNIYPD